MNYRIANAGDVKGLFEVRMSVTENILFTTDLVTDDICRDYLERRGRGWLCEHEGRMAGFAIADLEDDSMWALFVRPEYEGIGIGGTLYTKMLDWYFEQGKELMWLSTDRGTKAEKFYRRRGWTEAGQKGSEIRFELTASAYAAVQETLGTLLCQLF